MHLRAAATNLEIGGRAIQVSSPERVLWPQLGWTKADLIAYLRAVAPALLPHLAGRGVTVAPYSLRATRGGPQVSTPVSWAELESALALGEPRALRFTPAAVLDRLARARDLFAPVLG